MLCGPNVVKEQVLRSFFEGEISAAALAADLIGSAVTEGVVRRHLIENMTGELTVEPSHLMRVCESFISGQLGPEAIQSIGFCLVSSDSFCWDSDTPEGERVAEVIHDWSSSEINLPVTLDNMGRWRSYLEGKGGRVQ